MIRAYSANVIDDLVLAPAGIDTSRVSYEYMPTDAFWTRDYGPWHIYEDGERRIVDLYYYPNRRKDDAVPEELGENWDEEVYTAPLYTEGGNFMTDGNGTCWASDGVLWYNELSETAIKKIYKDYLGCENMVFVGPIPGEGTTHIDMFSKVLDKDTILVAETSYALGGTQREIEALESAAKTYRYSPKADGGTWNIVRIPMTFDNDGPYSDAPRVYYSHTNSLILNDTVLVPVYNKGSDADALAVYQ
ncbi:agmatine deiminase family protein, partial [Myxococcota bacterium]|nr:agmatine deiminase family protein [Myxococcota bacterium]